MSEPQRFRVADIQAQMTLGGQIMEVHPDGPYVTYSEYARLAFKSECQAEGLNAFDNKLREAEAMIERLKEERDNLDKQLNDEINKSAMLCGQIMRLTEAGDAMAAVITQYRCSPWGQKVPTAFTVWDAWFAAKNGGQP